MHDLLSALRGQGQSPRHRVRRRRHRVRNGRRLAAVRALTAARLCRNGAFSSVVAAAEACGSNRIYVAAMLEIVAAENTALLNDIIGGNIPVLTAAAQVKQLSKLIAAFRTASADDRVAFARTIGPTVLFDNTLVPAM